MNTYIVTGTTRGIGRALADVVIADGNRLLSLSSTHDSTDGDWINVACDLSRSETVAPCLEKLLAHGHHTGTDALVLINNAGVLAPIGPLGRIREDRIQHHLQVNQVAPFILMSAFIRLSGSFAGSRRIINISSGAARHPYAGWGPYCASKAALEMMTRCAAHEQKDEVRPVSICAVSPGKVETDMQDAIRRLSPAQFPAQPQFVRAKAEGDLMVPQEVARLLVELDRGGQFQNGGIYDLRDTEQKNGVLRIEPLASMG